MSINITKISMKSDQKPKYNGKLFSKRLLISIRDSYINRYPLLDSVSTFMLLIMPIAPPVKLRTSILDRGTLAQTMIF